MTSFLTRHHRPGISPDIVSLVLGDDEFKLLVPDTYELLDIASTYDWPRLLPGCLLDEDADAMNERLADPDDVMTAGRLHVVAQSLGLYLYGWPFFTAARALGVIASAETAFRLWAITHIPRDPGTFSAMDWTCAAVMWQLEASGQKDEDRLARWAQLTVPGRLPEEAPGVSPGWMSA